MVIREKLYVKKEMYFSHIFEVNPSAESGD